MKGINSNKKKTDKLGKTLSKLPTLNQGGGQSDGGQNMIIKKPMQGSVASDSEEYMNPQ